MQPNIFKKWWSYISDVHVESISSEYNESLHVLLKNGRYQLCTQNAVYSYADKYDNFRNCFNQLKLENKGKLNVLLLGFGLGSIPYMLEKTFQKDYSYTGIEIDDAIIYLASKYVLNELTSEISMIQADAANFVIINQEPYDMICIDIFVDDRIPEHFLSPEFLLDVKDNLADDGIILFNHLGYTSADKNAAKDYYENVFSKLFPMGKMLSVHKNFIMVSQTIGWLHY